MIVPMKKYTFLAHHTDYVDFLNALRSLGVLHVQYRKTTPSDELLDRLQAQKEIKETLQAMRTRIVIHEPDVELKETDGWEIVRSWRELSEQLEVLEIEKKGLLKELDSLRPWGEYSLESLDRLREAGLEVRFFSCPVRKFKPEWKEKYALRVIEDQPPDLHFAIVAFAGEEIVIDAEEWPAPTAAPGPLRTKLEDLKERMERVNRRLDLYATAGMPPVEAALRDTEETTQLLYVIENTRKEAADTVMLLTGFVPAPREEAIAGLCDRQGILYLSERAKPEDAPPVLLKNTAFSRLFEPIGQLFSLPAYQELDLTPFFAPFFMMFFGFCLGDAGYGLIVLLGATLYKLRAKKSFRPVLTLAQFLGVATIIFGVLTGTFFGVNLLESRFAYLGGIRDFMLDSDQTFQLALLLGLVQILFGLVIKALNRARQFGWAYAVSTFGWIVLLLSLLDTAYLKLTPGITGITVWVGVGLILLMNDPRGGILSRLGKGIWELYGITGFFGDVLSYIRLFALGISSAILGFVVNDISLQIRDGIPYLGPVLFVLFLVVGHGANLLIASLGAFVHPMRLTFVEFYKNAGFTGGGKAYQPLSRDG
jgi:V/A-type H+-transporting ATPase subunit I